MGLLGAQEKRSHSVPGVSQLLLQSVIRVKSPQNPLDWSLSQHCGLLSLSGHICKMGRSFLQRASGRVIDKGSR